MSNINVGDLEMSYSVQGRGSALLLVAGTGYPGATWCPELLDLMASDHTVVTYDHRGTGDTVGETDGLTTRGLAADALGLLQALDIDSAHVLGHSMGGRVAQWMALDGGPRVTSVILAASGPGPLPGSTGHTRGVPAAAAAGMVELGYQEYVRRVQRQTFFTEQFCVEQPASVEWLAQAFWEHRPSVLDYFRHVAARQEHDTVDRLQDIHQRCLVLVGDLDTHRRGTGSHVEQSQYLASALPDATLSLLPDVKHGFLWQEPASAYGRIKSWLAGR